jgi:hypothetical protein
VHLNGDEQSYRKHKSKDFPDPFMTVDAGRVAPSAGAHVSWREKRVTLDVYDLSDEFTVPLCRGHRRELHRCADEAAWWTKLGLDPIAAARTLWLKSHPLPERMRRTGNLDSIRSSYESEGV